MKAKLLFLTLSAIILYSCSSNVPEQNKLWLNDFEILKEEMVRGYANLKHASEKENMNLVELNDSTILKLRASKTKEEAQKIIKIFLRKFKDGHLRASIIEEKNITDESEIKEPVVDYPKSTEQDSIALNKMDFEDKKLKTRISFDSISGYTPLSSKNNPFSAGIIKSKNNKIGVLRIKIFMPYWFWETSKSVWKDYRKTFEGNCDGDCQWSFLQEVERKLTNKLIERIHEFKNEGISALMIDVSSNGGGTEWCNVVAQLFANKDLKHLNASFIKHEHWKNRLENHLKSIVIDLENPIIKNQLKKKLRKFKLLIEDLISKTDETCSANEVWEKHNTSCLELIKNPIVSHLPFGISEDPQYSELESKQMLSLNRFSSYEKKVYDGPLFIVQDRYSGSATEEFNSLLQANDPAVIVGENSYGAGCGYTNGGIKTDLNNIGLSVRMPDCARFMKDGRNEIYSIQPDIRVHWNKEESKFEKGEKIINSVIEYINNKS